MMLSFVAIVIGYLIGALPMGYIFLQLFKHQDITLVGSGRTGGTNAMRAGGVWMGILTGASDVVKGFLVVWIARQLAPGMIWVHVLAGAAAVFGHNWSLWLYIFSKRLTAGAGTGPNVGAAIAFWPPIVFILVPTVVFFVFIVGYASVASIVAALLIPVIFAILAYTSGMPWEYAIYGLITCVLVVWALRPNISRLMNGTERRVGIFARPRPQ